MAGVVFISRGTPRQALRDAIAELGEETVRRHLGVDLDQPVTRPLAVDLDQLHSHQETAGEAWRAFQGPTARPGTVAPVAPGSSEQKAGAQLASDLEESLRQALERHAPTRTLLVALALGPGSSASRFTDAFLDELAQETARSLAAPFALVPLSYPLELWSSLHRALEELPAALARMPEAYASARREGRTAEFLGALLAHAVLAGLQASRLTRGSASWREVEPGLAEVAAGKLVAEELIRKESRSERLLEASVPLGTGSSARVYEVPAFAWRGGRAVPTPAFQEQMEAYLESLRAAKAPVDAEELRRHAFAPNVLERTRLFVARDEQGQVLYSLKAVELDGRKLPLQLELEALRASLEKLREQRGGMVLSTDERRELDGRLEALENDLAHTSSLLEAVRSTSGEKVVEIGAAYASPEAASLKANIGQALYHPVMNALSRETGEDIGLLISGSAARLKLYLGPARAVDAGYLMKLQSDPERLVLAGKLSAGSEGAYHALKAKELDFTPQRLVPKASGPPEQDPPLGE